jgi:photosystem II stability/assembly factor-like uncharacterized protein
MKSHFKYFLAVIIIFFNAEITFCGSGWTEQFSTGLEFPTSIAFADSLNGIITGYFSCERTSDGGASWEMFNPAVALNYSNACFISQDTGFLSATNSNSGLYKTTDKGISWTRILSSNRIQSFKFIDPLSGYLAESNGNISRTNDGGLSWSVVTVSVFVPVSIDFADEDHGIMINSAGRGLMTTNGGNNWSSLFLATGYGGKVSYPETGFVYVASNSREDTDVLRKSTDNALSWTSVYFYNSRFTGIQFLNALTGTVTGNYSLVMRTTDGGQSWTHQSLGSSFYSVSAVFFLNINLGWLINSEGVVYKTYDGGESRKN